jgi:hypothetical protein
VKVTGWLNTAELAVAASAVVVLAVLTVTRMSACFGLPRTLSATSGLRQRGTECHLTRSDDNGGASRPPSARQRPGHDPVTLRHLHRTRLRSIVTQGHMRPRLVIILQISRQEPSQMSLI